MLVTLCTVYGDLLFFTDFLMDLALFYGVSRFGNFKTPLIFPVIAAVVGGLYSLFSVLPSFDLLRCKEIKLLMSFLLVKISFPYVKGKGFFVAFVYFYLISFAMAGAVMCLSWFFRGRGWVNMGFSYTAMGLSSAFLVVLLLSRWGSGYVRRTLRINDCLETVTISLDGKNVKVQALFDTGNELIDPVTRIPVIIVEYEAVKSLLPHCFCEVFERGLSADGVFSVLQPHAIASRLRLIPFHSIGESNGLLLGVRPDCISFPLRKKNEVKNVVICLYRGALHTTAHCRCIVNPAIFDMI